MKVYAEVSLNGEPNTSMRTTVDTAGERNPRWDFPLNYTINKASLRNPGLEVVVKLYCQRILGDKFIGEVKIPVKGLFDSGPKAKNELSFNVAGAGDGRLNILYSFGKTFTEQETSAWKKALKVGFVVIAQGTWFVLTGRNLDM
ncbi:protein SRC2 homolog [Salvia hispanica]|uniref:protein SRC2 homolog n=1 Tax=Salvia hispanica TaxID=49212 RepID=UPI00200992BC|nr:protein SRC2 homolog [Salvia hispanica]